MPTALREPITLTTDSDWIHWRMQAIAETGGRWLQVMKRRAGHPSYRARQTPAPGFYVSTTALYDRANPNPRDPHRYIDAAIIPYVVLHPTALRYAHLGDFATVVNVYNGKVSAAIVADESAPNLPVGEGSIALAEALGIASSPHPRRAGR